MKKFKIVVIIVTVLLVLTLVAEPIQAQDEPPTWDGEIPDLSQFTPRVDEGFPPEPITVNGLYYPVSPVNDVVYSRLPKLYFNRDYSATAYRVEITDSAAGITYKVKGAGTCSTWYCYLQPTTKLSVFDYPNTGGIFFWRVQAKIGGSWQPWSPSELFLVLSKGFTSTFDANRSKWLDVYGTWTLKNGSIKSPDNNTDMWNSIHYRDYFGNIDYTVTMKRKTINYNPSCMIIHGFPQPLSSIKRWDDGVYFCYGDNGVFGVFKLQDAALTWLTSGYISTSAIKPNDWNTLRAVVTSPYMDLWINGVYLGYVTGTFSSGLLGIAMYDSLEAKDPLLVDQAVVVADQTVTNRVHDPAMQLNANPVDLDLVPEILPSDSGASGTR